MSRQRAELPIPRPPHLGDAHQRARSKGRSGFWRGPHRLPPRLLLLKRLPQVRHGTYLLLTTFEHANSHGQRLSPRLLLLKRLPQVRLGTCLLLTTFEHANSHGQRLSPCLILLKRLPQVRLGTYLLLTTFGPANSYSQMVILVYW